MKIFTIYKGWAADGLKRSRLVNKKMLAGMKKRILFHQKWEALIEQVYDTEVIFQQERFHIRQEIKRKIRDKAT